MKLLIQNKQIFTLGIFSILSKLNWLLQRAVDKS